MATRRLVARYGIRVVPTLIIDGKVKVEGRLDEPWVCGDDFYEMLEKRYPLVNAGVLPEPKEPASTGRPSR